MQKEGKATTQEGNSTNVSSMRDECVKGNTFRLFGILPLYF